jgi:NAD dependent epimerase/dehydratase family enzyme
VSWVHHRDLAALYRFALENDQLSGAVNGGAPNPVRMSALAADIAHHIHRPSWFPVPVEVLRIVMGEVADYVVMSQRMTAEKALDAGFTYDFPTLEQALEDLLPEQRDGASEPAAEQSA